jgi:hypothetical protein
VATFWTAHAKTSKPRSTGCMIAGLTHNR